MAYQLPGRPNAIKPLTGPGNELYDTLARTSPTSVGRFFRFIDTPARKVREFLTNKPNATGSDVLRQAGLHTGNTFVDTPLELGTEMLLDPLNLVSFGTGAAGKAARAARAANILDDAPRAFSRMLVDSGEAAAKFSDSPSWTNLFSPDSVGIRAGRGFKKVGITDDAGGVAWNKLTDNDLYSRPLVGQSSALRRQLPGTNRKMTLRDLANAQADSAKAFDDIAAYAKRNKVRPNSLLDQQLYKDVGVSLPGLGTVGMDIPVLGEKWADAMSAAGQAVRWNPAGRRAMSMFDNRVRGTVDEGEQIIARRLSRADELAGKKAAGRVSDLIASIDPEVLKRARTSDGGRVLRSLVEGTTDLLDQNLVDAFRKDIDPTKLDAAVDSIKTHYADYLKESRDAGIKSSSLQDAYGTNYMGRILDRDLYPDMKKAGVGSSPRSVLTGDMQPRGQEFVVPGGTNTITELSGMEFLRDKSLSDKDVAARVLEFMRSKEEMLKGAGKLPDGVRYSRANAMKLGRKLRAMDADALEGGKRLFAQNPFEIIDKYSVGRERAMARAKELQTLLAQTARPGARSTLGGGGYKSVTQMARDLGMESKRVTQYVTNPPAAIPGSAYEYGAAKNIIDTMRSFGIEVDSQTLRKFSTDPELRDRLENIAKFYTDDRTKTEFAKAVGAVTANFKQWVLAVPRRYARDWYSGFFSNFVTHTNAKDLYAGYDVTKDIMQENWTAAVAKLKKMPRYSGLSDDAVLDLARKDMAQSGMSQTGRLEDIGYENIGRESGRDTFAKYMGGDGRPITTPAYASWDAITGNKAAPSLASKAYAGSELATSKGWFDDILPFDLKDSKGNFSPSWNTKRQTRNPILRASARAAEVTDEINRLGGYFAMIAGGNSPEAAAKAITRAQIDYSSLTPFERRYIGMLFPFWAYLSRVSVWGVREMAQGQTYFNTAIRAPQVLSGARGSEYAPTRIEEKYGVKIPDEYRDMLEPLLGSNLEGATYLSDIDIPFIDSLLMIDPVVDPQTGAMSVGGTAVASLQALAGQTNPLVKSAVENISGRDLYTKTELDPTRRTIPTLARRAGFTDAATQSLLGSLEPAVTTMMPGLTYPLSTARRITSEKTTPVQGATQAAFNLLTGTRIETVGPEEELRDVRERIGRYLKESPYARQMNVTYIPEEQKEFVPQRVNELYELDKELQKRVKQHRESRVRGNPLLTY